MYITVGKFKEIIEKEGLEDDDIIVLSSDSEANSLLPASKNYNLGVFDKVDYETTFDETIDKMEIEEKEQFSSNDDLKRCIIMFPV